MSKVFITKNGQFLSRGEGVLTQIENPDLEVNDIGVEVSEKIAEDVKEGDLVYSYMPVVDELGTGQATRGDETTFAHDKRFFVYENNLYYLCMDYRNQVLYKYENDEWVEHVSQDDIGKGFLDTYTNVGSVFTFGDDVYSVARPYPNNNYPNHVIFQKFEDPSWRQFDPFWGMDASAKPDFEKYSANGEDNLNRFWEGVDMIEASGVIHLVLGHDSDSSSVNPFTTYTFDKTTEKLTRTTCNDLSSTHVYQGSQARPFLYEQNGSLFLILHHGYDNTYPTERGAELYKWNPSTSNWDGQQRIPTNHGVSKITSVVVGGERWFLFVMAQSHVGNLYIYRHNDSTGQIEGYFDFGSEHPVNLGYWSFSVDSEMFVDASGDPYILTQPLVTYGGTWRGDEYVFLYKLNTDTSTVSFVTSGGLDFADDGSTYTNQVIKVALHDGKLHTATTRNAYETFSFGRIDTATSSMSRPQKWKQPIRSVNSYAGMTAFGEFSGVHYFVQGGYNPRSYTYTPSSGVFELMKFWDVTLQYAYDFSLFEDDGKFYMYTTKPSWASPGYAIYELDVSANQFKKLADTITISNHVTSHSFIQFSGLNYLAIGGVNASNPIDVYTLSGNTFSSIEPSTLPVGGTRDFGGTDFEIYNGELFLATACDTGATDETSLRFYKLEGQSNWITLDFSSGHKQIGVGRTDRYETVNLYQTSSGLYAIASQLDGFPQIHHYKYDGSGFVAEYDGVQQTVAWQRRENIQHQELSGIHYFVMVNAGQDANRNGSTELMVLDPDKGWRRYGLDRHNMSQPQYYSFNKAGNELFVSVGLPNLPITNRMYKVSEFLGQRVWKKKAYGAHITTPLLGTGIALQDGSKGDIIKIRRIKR